MTLFSATVGHKHRAAQTNRLESARLLTSVTWCVAAWLSDSRQDQACAHLNSLLLAETKTSACGAAPKTQFSHIGALLSWKAAQLCSYGYLLKCNPVESKPYKYYHNILNFIPYLLWDRKNTSSAQKVDCKHPHKKHRMHWGKRSIKVSFQNLTKKAHWLKWIFLIRTSFKDSSLNTPHSSAPLVFPR